MLQSKGDTKPFTFVPDRRKDIPKKRFAKRTTSVRPITFFKNWDNTFSPSSVTEPVELNSPRCFSQPAQHSRVQNKNTSTHKNNTCEDGDKENTDIGKHTTLTRNSSANDETTGHLQDKESLNVNNETNGGTLLSRKDRSANLESLVTKIQEKRKSIELKEISHKESSVNITPQGKDGLSKTDEVQKDIIEQSVINQSIHQISKNNTYIENISKSVSNDSDVPVPGTNCATPVSESNNLAKDTGSKIHGGNEPEENNLEQEENCESSDKESDNQIYTEEFDITHKIPLAQSTAIGIEIEQDFDEEDDEHVINDDNAKEDLQERQENSSESQQQLKRKLTMSTPKRSIRSSVKKRKISITGPVKVQNIVNQSVEVEERQENETNKSISRVKGKSKKKTIELANKTQDGRHSSLTFNPHVPSTSTATSSSVPEETPDLRKAMLLSYAMNAATPSGITPGYIVATPVSGPVYRNSQKRRPTKVPVPVEIASDSSDQVGEVRLWQCDAEIKRKSTDISDLDVTLQAFEELAWHFKENIEMQPIKKAVMLCAKKTQMDLRSLITQTHKLKTWRSSYTKVRFIGNNEEQQIQQGHKGTKMLQWEVWTEFCQGSCTSAPDNFSQQGLQNSIKKKRLDLFAIQKEYTSCKADLATLRLEHGAALIKSQRYTDTLAFQQAVRDAQKGMHLSLKECKGQIKRHIVCPKPDDHSTNKVSQKELEKIQQKNKTLLQRQFNKSQKLCI